MPGDAAHPCRFEALFKPRLFVVKCYKLKKLMGMCKVEPGEGLHVNGQGATELRDGQRQGIPLCSSQCYPWWVWYWAFYNRSSLVCTRLLAQVFPDDFREGQQLFTGNQHDKLTTGPDAKVQQLASHALACSEDDAEDEEPGSQAPALQQSNQQLQ